jgi:predicted metal-dependent phosphoesterase TrpH
MTNPARTFKLDLHVHSRELSGCAKSSAEEMILAAIGRGIDGLVFTDHDRLVPPRRIEELRRRYAPFMIHGGIEVMVSVEHVLVLGLSASCLETRRWSYPDLHGFVRDAGGYLVLAHPYRFRDTVEIDIGSYPPDAIELRSKNIRPKDEHRIRALAESVGAQLVCNSDAHRAKDVGSYYNLVQADSLGLETLVELLRTRMLLCNGSPPTSPGTRP